MKTQERTFDFGRIIQKNHNGNRYVVQVKTITDYISLYFCKTLKDANDIVLTKHDRLMDWYYTFNR